MSVIQVANQIIMFLTPTYILDHILGFVGEVLVKHTKNNKKNSKQKTLFYKKGSQECTCISCGSFLRENFCRLGSSTIIWKENLSICLLQRRRCLLQFLQKACKLIFATLLKFANSATFLLPNSESDSALGSLIHDCREQENSNERIRNQKVNLSLK